MFCDEIHYYGERTLINQDDADYLAMRIAETTPLLEVWVERRVRPTDHPWEKVQKVPS